MEMSITYNFISPNFNIYFSRNIHDKLTDEFNYIYSDKRKSLEFEFSRFLDNDSEMIYPICGPHNIGKTITAMRIQKSNYLKGIKSLYLDLKYYFYQPFQDFEKKIDTLIKECIYFIDSEEQLLELYNEFQKLNKIKDVISILPKHLASKNLKKNKFFLIIDQYQEKYDSNDILDLFSNYKIFLLSSINDTDVKNNLILIQKEKSLKKYKLLGQNQVKKIIRYTYYEYLFDFNYCYLILFENLIKKKLKNEEKNGQEKKENDNDIKEENEVVEENEESEIKENEINTNKNKEEIKEEKTEKLKVNNDNEIKEKFTFVSSVLKKYNYIPKYCFGFIYKYNTIYDLLFFEYKNIFIKLLQFQNNNSIDVYKLKDLIKDNNILESIEPENSNYKTLSEEEYIIYLKYIPLKYINFHLNEKGELYFYYSFPLFKQILKDFIDYYESKDNFFVSNSGSQKGNYFKSIVKAQLKVFNRLNIDGHLEVRSIIDMNFTENYKLLDKEYLKGKKNILITQENSLGKDYDFAIYKPEDNQLLLLQSKYQIEHKLIKDKSEYIESSQEVLKNFKKSFNNENIEKVYLLYISSEEYNIKRKISVSNLLDKHEINCLFYSVSNDEFSFNFKEIIKDIECKDSFMLLPKIQEYKKQDIQIEKKISKKNTNSELIFLNKKHKKSYNKEKIYNDLKSYILTKKIGFSMGKLIEIESFSDEEIKMNKNQYIIIFSLNEEDDSTINFKKPIGLIYSEKKEKQIYLELTDNKIYSKYEELFMLFSSQSYYGIGDIDES